MKISSSLCVLYLTIGIGNIHKNSSPNNCLYTITDWCLNSTPVLLIRYGMQSVSNQGGKLLLLREGRNRLLKRGGIRTIGTQGGCEVVVLVNATD